jgi:ligand-binding sensor domain-containing protein/tRNA A-37 threonylcarbamoyl transferase component Bud32
MQRFSRIFASMVLWMAAAFGQQYGFLPVEGSPKNVKTLFQDSQGRLWLGGDRTTCFDGTRFFSLLDYGMPATNTYGFAEDPAGAIWIATQNGVYRFAKGRVELIAPGVATSVVAPTADLAAASLGPAGSGLSDNLSLVLMRRTGGHWKAETVMALESPGPLTLDSTSHVVAPWPLHGWLEMDVEDLARWRVGSESPAVRHLRPGTPAWPLKVLRDRKGCLWIGTTGGNAYDCGDGPHNALAPHLRPETNLHDAADGSMVLWGDSLLAIGRPGAFQMATLANGLPGLVDAIPSQDGTVWLGTTHGLYRLTGGTGMEYWTAREGLPDAPWSVTRSGGRVYAGLDRRIVVLSQDRSRWETVATLEGGTVSGLSADADGNLLAAFSDGGVVELTTGGKVLARTPQDGTTGSMRLARTPDGESWLGGDSLGQVVRTGGLLNIRKHALETQPSRNVLAVKYEERTRKLWSCYNGGAVVRDQHGTWRELTTRDGLLIDGCWSLAPLPNGDVWYAYFNLPALGLIRPNAGGGYTVRQFQGKEGTPEPGGDTIDLDRDGRLWRGGDLGVYTATPEQAENGHWLRLDLSDGLPTNGMNSGSVFADTDGSLWWGADNDLAHYSPPADLVAPAFAPRVFVSAFSWDGGAPRLAESLDGVPHGSKVVAHIGSLQFDRRNALEVRYRLLPEQSGWRESKSLDLSLGKLLAGTHTLEVQGRVYLGPWSSSTMRTFTVPRPFGLTWPLLVAYFLTASLMTASWYWWHRRRQAEEAQILPDLAAWRLGALLPDVHEVSGTVLDGRFEAGALLARGGFANVFAGFDRERKQACAVKIFRSEMQSQNWIQRTFEQEVTALQKIRHSNVVTIYARGVALTGAPYLVMEFVEGRNLREVLEAGPIAPARTARLLRQLAGALDAIHAQGICHRDVKPENIMVRHEESAEESAMLIDFSIAIVKDANETLHGLSRAAGSFDYMAPEQAIGYAEPSSDVYSLAKVALEMMTRRQLKELLPDAAMDLPDRVRGLLRNLNMNLAEDSVEMFATALEFDPSRRPQAAGQFAAPIVRDLQSPVRLGGGRAANA